MRWPSVYLWGWFMVPGRFLVLVGALASAYLASNLLPWRHVFEWSMILSFLALAAVTMALTACPRCGRNIYQRSGWWSNNLWPVSKCSKCGLDLKRFGPFDGRAKREG